MHSTLVTPFSIVTPQNSQSYGFSSALLASRLIGFGETDRSRQKQLGKPAKTLVLTSRSGAVIQLLGQEYTPPKFQGGVV